ncbi:hypothetical protein M8H41_19365 [Desulfosporosinus nitroreducens]|uniref:Uncharacterized protein n=1 Tax=Desulfosporosinus nitroreducens TaxID=2018668 RepID=A0ABT8QUF5_9FIRM|nr:hypothetical protein [Desulfosporosinus nitroreducens]
MFVVKFGTDVVVNLETLLHNRNKVLFVKWTRNTLFFCVEFDYCPQGAL